MDNNDNNRYEDDIYSEFISGENDAMCEKEPLCSSIYYLLGWKNAKDNPEKKKIYESHLEKDSKYTQEEEF